MGKLLAFAVEILELLLILLGAGVAAVAGLALEQFGFTALTGGDLVVGAWAMAMGLIALYIAIVAIGYEQVLPRIQPLIGSE